MMKTSRQIRRERRETERKAKKAEWKRLKAESALNPAMLLPASEEDESENDLSPEPIAEALPGFVSQRAQINRQNARHSTGPRSSAGKLASSRNSLKHGLASGQLIIPGENSFAFESLRHDLMNDHQPANPTEELLVHEMAQAYWLTQRAIRLQNDCFTEDGIDEKRLALFLRYQSTHERRFHKALSALLKLKKDRRKAHSGFVSHRAANVSESDGFVSHETLSISDPDAQNTSSGSYCS